MKYDYNYWGPRIIEGYFDKKKTSSTTSQVTGKYVTRYFVLNLD